MSSTDLVQITEDFIFSFRRSNYFTACLQAERGIMKNLFLTNCSCPKCRKPLYLSDIEGYSFVCKNCDENFYSLAVSCNSAIFFKVYFGATQGEYEKNLTLLRQIRKKHKASVFAYDYLKKQVEICWAFIPSGDSLNEFIRDMQNIDISSVTYQIVITETLQKVITVSADSLKEAQEKVKSMYNNSDIVLTADDHVDTEFRPY